MNEIEAPSHRRIWQNYPFLAALGLVLFLFVAEELQFHAPQAALFRVLLHESLQI